MLGSAAYRLLELIGATAAWREIRRGRLILCYHNVLPHGAMPVADRSLHLPREQFERQLDWLMARFDVVPLDAAISGTSPTRGTRSHCAITFDDAYRGVLANALPALRARGLPSTVFVCSGPSSAPATFWWDRVASRRPDLDRVAVRDRSGGRGVAILAGLGLEDGPDDLPADYLPATWNELRAAAGEDLILGAHTISHPMLTRLTDAELRDELAVPRDVIREHTGQEVSAVAYPYGDVDARIAAAAGAAGYRLGVTTAGTLIRGDVQPLLVPRVNIPSSMKGAAFAAAASGLRRAR